MYMPEIQLLSFQNELFLSPISGHTLSGIDNDWVYVCKMHCLTYHYLQHREDKKPEF
jgi:hypothetical protein